MTYLLDDFSRAEASLFGTAWELFSDQMLDGASEGRIERQAATADDPACLHLHGELHPGARNGFLQLALPLVSSRYLFDARHFSGVRIACRSLAPAGFGLLLRTKELSMPWQHYRADFAPTAQWAEYRLPLADFVPVQTAHALNSERLSRLAITVGPPAERVDFWLAEIGFY